MRHRNAATDARIDKDQERILGEIEKLVDKGDRRVPEKDAALALMVRLVEDYEEKRYPLPKPSPHEMLLYLMEQRGAKSSDLAPVFKSKGYASDVINGKRAISRAMAKQLGEFFHVSGDLFL
ncbi:MAG TPA: hypothetical protein VKU19_22110 [Bryobacteraceae bacterium]|nr:hypothetical protein [Bryobacteraceae bacterium]